MEISMPLVVAFIAGAAAVLLWHNYNLGEVLGNLWKNISQPSPPPAKTTPTYTNKTIACLLTAANWVAQVNSGTLSPTEQEQKVALFLKSRLEEMFTEQQTEEKLKRTTSSRSKKEIS